VQVLGISFDSVAENAAFARKFSYSFPLLCDTRREAGLAYGACDDARAAYARRITYLIGTDGRVVRGYGKVNAARHAQEVLADLGEASPPRDGA
jgi:peroxiredoxin Q/BCP